MSDKHPSRSEALAMGYNPTGSCVDDSKCDGTNCSQVWFYDEFVRDMFDMLIHSKGGYEWRQMAKYPGWTSRLVSGRRILEHSSNTVDRKRIWVLIDRRNTADNATLGVWPD